MFDWLYLVSVVVSSVIGFGVGLILMRLYGRMMVSAMLKSITGKINQSQPLFRLEYNDGQNLSIGFNIPKLVQKIEGFLKEGDKKV